MVYDPPAHVVSSVAHLNTSAAEIYHLMDGSSKTVPETHFWAFADVRDAALAHRLAYESPAAAAQRYLITSGNYSFQQVCDVLRARVPEVREPTPEGEPGSGLGREVYGVSNEKAGRDLGMRFRGLEECIVDTARSLLELERAMGKA